MDWLGDSGDGLWHTGAGDDGTVRAFVGRDALLDDLRARLRAGRGFAIATLNLDHAVKLRSDTAFRAAYAAHTHITADGHPIVWLERLAGRRTERVTGADLVVPLARLAAAEGCPVALVGSTEPSLDGAAERLARDAPSLRVAAKIAPPQGFDPCSDGALPIFDALEDSGARLCFLALGAPKQELFAARAAERLPGIGFASVGAGLDFLSGHQSRAPRAVQALALEWAWRLARDPRRLCGRYAACAAALPGLALAARRTRTPDRARASA